MTTSRHLSARILPAALAITLCASLFTGPAPQAIAADGQQTATTAQHDAGSNASSSTKDEDTAAAANTANTTAKQRDTTAATATQQLESVIQAEQAAGSPSITLNGTAYDTLKAAIAAASDGDVIETKGAIALDERLTLTAVKTVTVRAVADTTLTRPAGIHMVAMDRGTLKFEAAGDAALTFEGAAAASNFSAFYAAGSARIVLGRNVAVQNFKANNLNKGVVEINGGTVVFEGGVMSNCVGGVTVAGGSSTLEVTDGSVTTVTQNTSGTVRIGGKGKVTDRVTVNGNAKVTVTAALTGHTPDDPLTLTAASFAKNRVVASFPSKELAAATLGSITAVTTAGETVRLRVTNATITVANIDELLDQIDNPFTDNLRTHLISELDSAEKIAQAKTKVASLAGLSDDEKTAYTTKLDELETTRDYLERNREAVDASVIELSRLGDLNAEKNRTQQGYEFDNMDFSGFYVRPGSSVRFRVYVEADNPNQVAFGWRQTGHMDLNNYLTVWVPDRARFSAGLNEVTVDASQRTVGLAVFLRNYGTGRARVRIEAMDASNEHPVVGTTLGRYPYYVYDAEHPERFWQYVQETREYAKTVDTVTNYVGNLPGRLDLNADMTGLLIGRSVFTTSATDAVNHLFAKITDEQSATAYITKAYQSTESRLEYFDHIMGFDDADEKAVHHHTPMRVVTESSQNLTSPSTMFAFTYLQSLPIGAEAVLLDGTGPNGWGLDHEFGHTVDLGPLIIGEETNNLISLWGRVRAEKARVEAEGGEFSISTYHGNITGQSLPTYKKYLADVAAGKDASMNWNDVFLAVMIRWQILRYFDEYDYEHDGLEHDASIVAQIKKYGTLGTMYRLVREDPTRYNAIDTKQRRDRMVAAFSEVTGFNMAEVFSRLGVTPGDEAKQFASRYPSFDKPVEYYTTDADVKVLNGVTGYDTANLPTPKVDAKRNADGGITITATMPDAASAKSTIGWRLYADGKEAGYSDTGTFTVDPGVKIPVYSVVAYDVKLNASKTVKITNTVDVTLSVAMVVAGGADSGKATATAVITPKDGDLETRKVTLKDGKVTLKAVPLATVTITCDGCTASPDTFDVDPFDWSGSTVPVTVTADDMADVLGRAPKPTIRAAAVDADGKETASGGTMAFVIDVAAGEDVYYTTDGSEPNSKSGTRYVAGDAIRFAGASLTVKARAYRTGYNPSEVAEATWTATQKAAIHSNMWGGGTKLEMLPGEYSGKEQLGELYENTRSVTVPAGYKVTLYGNPNTLTYTASASWLGNYTINQRIQRVKVEVLNVPALTDAYTLKFAAGEASGSTISGSMADQTVYRGVTTMLPAVGYYAPGYKFAGWKGSDGHDYTDGQSVTDLAAKGATVTLTAQWTAAECVEGSACLIDPYRAAGDSSKWTAPTAPEGKTFAGWYVDEKLTRSIPKAMRAGLAYPKFVDAAKPFAFKGGSLRADYTTEDGETDFTRTSMRFGYQISPISGTTVTAWGWKYGASPTNLVGSAKGVAKTDYDDGSFLSNLVVRDFTPRIYARDVYSRMWITYVTADGTPVTLQDEVRSRSIRAIAESIVAEGSGAGEDEVAYAKGILAQITEE
ncbi:chitobiase/beta-hexosaminidase C-terminal domain-containing protein [Bifidobacterium leontopitheci]|uniref:Peptidase M60 domain-containing protein n=1 Tax=Bifidobacterium leontopitheci TaxID=2650774 RepID=A0A6I1GKY3_9BIFI|nr:chitobiase/beta-hexosaminidase C-terminal domain-containing protein [Bifidobacterium leontopitheci]KAB7790027.1 hypothetical protein F7D09_1445 [Bifidobacterium leontopitheci]